MVLTYIELEPNVYLHSVSTMYRALEIHNENYGILIHHVASQRERTHSGAKCPSSNHFVILEGVRFDLIYFYTRFQWQWPY